MQTKAPNKRQLADDSEDDYNSSIDRESSMSVEAAQRSLIWRNDTSSSTSRRKVSRLRNVSTIEDECKSTPHLSSAEAEFKGRRLATRIHEWYRARVQEKEFIKLPAQKSTIRISDADRAVQPMYLYDPEKVDKDLEHDYMVPEPPRKSSKWGPRPYSLAESVYEYDTEDEGQRGFHRDAQDHFYENHTNPLHQFLTYLEDGGRRRLKPDDTGNG